MNLKTEVAVIFAIFMLSSLYYTPFDLESRENLQFLDDSFHISKINDTNYPTIKPSSNLHENYIAPSSVIAPAPGDTSGVIDSRMVEQVGYYDPGNYSARTDTGLNCIKELPIDTANDWQASSADIDIWNLERFYLANDTLDEGVPGTNTNPYGNVTSHPFGWDSFSNTTDTSTTQISGYVESDRSYVTVENQGKTLGTGINERTQHAVGTEILWAQIIQNAPYSEDFVFSTDFLYKTGPLDPGLGSSVTLIARMDGTEIWSINLTSTIAHEVWYHSGDISVHIPSANESILFEIGLKINETIALYHDTYDILDAHYITAYLDDISLIGIAPPDFDSIDMQFHVGGQSVAITGNTGIGNASIINPSYWTTDIVTMSISSNASVSFDYHVRMKNHRFLNSSWTNDVTEQGVYYSINPGNNSELDLFTYLAFIGTYDELKLIIYHPIDWDNFVVFDPFFNDVTSSCLLASNYVEIPTVLLDTLGWWQIHCESPNYATDAESQRYDIGTTTWVPETVYHTGDSIRLSVNISTSSQIPLLSDPVNFTWGLPNCTTWYESSITSGLVGSAISGSVDFGATNTTAGLWCISYLWTNGTEVGYGYVEFTLQHQAALEVLFEDDLATVVGQPVKIVVLFHDTENGLLILNEGASISSTWAGGTVDFEVNIIKNWWEADFDTASVGAGNFNVTIVSSTPYFESSALVVIIESQYQTDLITPTGPLQPLLYSRSYSFMFFYSRSYDSLGIGGASVDITEEGSEWASITDNGGGNYNLTLTPLGERDYNIRITFSRVGYENQTFVLSFLVEKVPIEVHLLSPLSAQESSPVDLEIEIVETDSRLPVLGANVTFSILSSGGDYYIIQTMDELADGHYTISFSMPAASSVTYSLIIQVAKEHYELAQNYQDTLVPLVDTDAQLLKAVIQYTQQFATGIFVLVAAVATQRVFARKNRRKRAAARAIEIRFDDAENLLGLLVLHKVSGVPVYSKILKGGFEEGMLSAFISAIMHFRSEFDTVEMDDEYKALPISDIIRAVPTPNLICAFITVSSPSPEQEQKMVGYARAIGMMLDDTLKNRPTQVVDAKTAKTFEWLFDDFVDGGLLRKYQVGEKELPRKFKSLTKAISEISSDDMFKLNDLLRALENDGVSEYDAYLLVMEAIEKELILPIYSFNDVPDSKIEQD